MQLGMSFFYGAQADRIKLAQQMGIKYAVTNIMPGERLLPNGIDYDFSPFLNKLDVFREAGLQVTVVESPTPLEKTKLGLPGRDEEIEVFLKMFKILYENKIDTVCYNWMPAVGWYRTLTEIKARGGATVTGYKHDTKSNLELTEYGHVPSDKLWDDLVYFHKAVLPDAEKYGIKLALHPDDPPVEELKGISRILISLDALKKATSLVQSPNNGVTLCQGCITTMGENPLEAIEYFGGEKKLFFAHFRDVRGNRYNFEETFHDDGPTDMYACMKQYYKVGFSGTIRPDHVPTMLDEKADHPGYSALGNLFAVGYMKGLMEAIEKGDK